MSNCPSFTQLFWRYIGQTIICYHSNFNVICFHHTFPPTSIWPPFPLLEIYPLLCFGGRTHLPFPRWAKILSRIILFFSLRRLIIDQNYRCKMLLVFFYSSKGLNCYIVTRLSSTCSTVFK